MAWEVEYTDEFGDWWNGLTSEERIELAAKVRLLEQHGPVLPRPHSDAIATSKHANMKELRCRVVFPHHRAEFGSCMLSIRAATLYYSSEETRRANQDGMRSMCLLPIDFLTIT